MAGWISWSYRFVNTEKVASSNLALVILFFFFISFFFILPLYNPPLHLPWLFVSIPFLFDTLTNNEQWSTLDNTIYITTKEKTWLVHNRGSLSRSSNLKHPLKIAKPPCVAAMSQNTLVPSLSPVKSANSSQKRKLRRH